MLEKPGRLRNLALPCAPKETSGGQVEVIFWRASPSKMVAEEPNYNGLMVIKTIKTIEKKQFHKFIPPKKGLPFNKHRTKLWKIHGFPLGIGKIGLQSVDFPYFWVGLLEDNHLNWGFGKLKMNRSNTKAWFIRWHSLFGDGINWDIVF